MKKNLWSNCIPVLSQKYFHSFLFYNGRLECGQSVELSNLILTSFGTSFHRSVYLVSSFFTRISIEDQQQEASSLCFIDGGFSDVPMDIRNESQLKLSGLPIISLTYFKL